MDTVWAATFDYTGGQVMGTVAEYINGALAVAIIALFLAIAHHIREALRRRRLRREIEQTNAWISALAAPTPPQIPADPTGSPTPVGSAGSNNAQGT